MKIGVSFTGNENKHNNYVQWLKLNEEIEVVKLSADNKKANRIADCDALVLSGGLDIHPKFYLPATDYTIHPETVWDEKRDEFEFTLMQSAMERSIPVLGICRGLQLINVFFKGTLDQHIREEDIAHQGRPDKKHVVNIKKGTLLYEIAETLSGAVNSAHHQSIEQLGEGLEDNSRSADNIIEGIEWKEKKGKPFLLGVQWHPERMNASDFEDSPLSTNIRDRFIQEVKLNSIKR